MQVHFVTGNTGKFEQVHAVLESAVQLVQTPLDIPEIQTSSLHEISHDKAVQAYTKTGEYVLVEDSGIYFEAFHQFPGALTKFIYTSIGLEGMKNLYTGVENTKAYFQCVMSVFGPSLAAPIQFEGKVHGHLCFDLVGDVSEDPRLPYDAIFVAEGMQGPVIQYMDQWKGGINHRVKAARKVGEWFLEYKTTLCQTK